MKNLHSRHEFDDDDDNDGSDTLYKDEDSDANMTDGEDYVNMRGEANYASGRLAPATSRSSESASFRGSSSANPSSGTTMNPSPSQQHIAQAPGGRNERSSHAGENHRFGLTRSRNGCLTCRTRKMKCGDEKPTCKNCFNLNLSNKKKANKPQVECVWPDVYHHNYSSMTSAAVPVPYSAPIAHMYDSTPPPVLMGPIIQHQDTPTTKAYRNTTPPPALMGPIIQHWDTTSHRETSPLLQSPTSISSPYSQPLGSRIKLRLSSTAAAAPSQDSINSQASREGAKASSMPTQPQRAPQKDPYRTSRPSPLYQDMKPEDEDMTDVEMEDCDTTEEDEIMDRKDVAEFKRHRRSTRSSSRFTQVASPAKVVKATKTTKRQTTSKAFSGSNISPPKSPTMSPPPKAAGSATWTEPYLTHQKPNPEVGGHLYFAYGPDMGRQKMEHKYHGAEFVGLAKLEDFHLFVNGNGKLGIFSNPIEATDNTISSCEPAPNTQGGRSQVWGMVWKLSNRDLELFREKGVKRNQTMTGLYVQRFSKADIYKGWTALETEADLIPGEDLWAHVLVNDPPPPYSILGGLSISDVLEGKATKLDVNEIATKTINKAIVALQSEFCPHTYAKQVLRKWVPLPNRPLFF